MKKLGRRWWWALIPGWAIPVLVLFLLVVAVVAGGAPTTKHPTPGTACGTPVATGAAPGLTAEQQANAAAIAGVALGLGLGERGVLVGIVAAMTESSLINVGHGDAAGPDSIGLFQERAPWGPLAIRTDPAGAAGLFYRGGLGGQRGLTQVPGWESLPPPLAAQAVEQSAYSDGSNYAKNLAAASAITTALMIGMPPSAVPVGAAPSCGAPAVVNVSTTGTAIALPAAAGIIGNPTVTAPNAAAAAAITAGLTQLGVTYAWGGGTATGPSLGIRDGGVADAHGDYNKTGFDCSGLMLYLWAQAGLSAPRGSQEQATSGAQIPYEQRLPGDMIGFPGHITLYLGVLNGTDYQLEAPESGGVVQVSPVRARHYPMVARIWAG